MKKNFFACLIVFINSILIISCQQNDNSDMNFNDVNTVNSTSNSKFTNLTEEELVSKLIVDEDFINYAENLLTFYTTMPTKNVFLNNFDDKVWEQRGISYLAELSGYTNLEIENKFNKIGNDLKILQDRYPQLIYDEKNDEFITNVINKASDQLNNDGIWAKNGCANCRKIHRPRVIMSTISGFLGGFVVGGVTGAGSNMVSHLIHALNDAGNCFDAAGC